MSDIAWDIPAGDLHPAIPADISTYLPPVRNAYLLQHNAMQDRRSKSKIYLHSIYLHSFFQTTNVISTSHTLSELTNILYLLALVILTLFSLVDTITEGSWHLLFIYYWLTHSLFLLLLAQLQRLVTTAHEQIAIEVGAGWKLDICPFQQGVRGNKILSILYLYLSKYHYSIKMNPYSVLVCG